MDAQTGRLRAVVNPRVAFEQAFPPGSAIKPFTALTALRAGLIDQQSRTLCGTRYERDGFKIVCSHPPSKIAFNLTKGLAYSCNYYFATVSERLSPSAFAATLGSVGFGSRTDVGANNESAGRLGDGEWHIQNALGEGQWTLVTPIQLLTAYAALFNGGRLFRPHAGEAEMFAIEERARLSINPLHRAVLIEGMRGAVSLGTAARAKLDSLPIFIFGKTGTSTASNGFRTQGWFIGLAARGDRIKQATPEAVELAVLVFLKRAHGVESAEIAGPIFEAYAKTVRALSGRPRDFVTGQSRGARDRSSDNGVRVRLVREGKTITLGLEDHVRGVLAGESSVEDQLEALKAQAVASRTFALQNLGRHAGEGYDFCSLTHCQRFVEVAEDETRAGEAVKQTAGEILQDESGRLAEVYYHAACGGMTANLETLWGAPAPSHLRGVRDDYCATRPNRRWTEEISQSRLVKALSSDPQSDVGARVDEVVITKQDATGRAEVIVIEGERRRRVRGWDFKQIVSRALGWNVLKSSRFEVVRRGRDFVFRGGGLGHGLGLCQQGAHVMAERGASYRQILDHYFPGTQPSREAAKESSPGREPWEGTDAMMRALKGRQSLWRSSFLSPHPGLAQWRGRGPRADALGYSLPPLTGLIESNPPTSGRRTSESRSRWSEAEPWKHARENGQPQSQGRLNLSSEHFRASYPPTVQRSEIEQTLNTVEAARTDLLHRLAGASLSLSDRSPVEIVIHATTQDFVAATGQPAWVAGATRGRRIQLQPVGVLRRRRALTPTLRHEYAHAVIEELGEGRAPRWLAEGLAIHFAGEGVRSRSVKGKVEFTTDELEEKLERPASVEEMRLLYDAAYRMVRALIEKDGEAGIWRQVAR
jgi:stage II sporulation protein D